MATQTKKGDKPVTNREANRPVQSWKLKGVHVAVFRNESEKDGSVFFKTSIQRVYKDGDEFKTTSSLGRDDLQVARLLLERAWEWILEAEAGNNGKEE